MTFASAVKPSQLQVTLQGLLLWIQYMERAWSSDCWTSNHDCVQNLHVATAWWAALWMTITSEHYDLLNSALLFSDPEFVVAC